MKPFNAAEISDHEENSDGITRFIASLTDEQAAACTDHELKHEKRFNVLALLSAQRSTKRQQADDAQSRNLLHTVRTGARTPTESAAILNALQLSRAHVRCPLDGSARADLIEALDVALALMGVR